MPAAIIAATDSLVDELSLEEISIRAITRRAGANVQAVQYYFGDKDSLLLRVLEIRLAPALRQADQNLAELERRDGERPALASLLHAVCAPFFELSPSTRALLAHYAQSKPRKDKLVRVVNGSALFDRVLAHVVRLYPAAARTTLQFRLELSVLILVHFSLTPTRDEPFQNHLLAFVADALRPGA